jgi:diguanylate cyclase (GGDEF)-like protein
LEQGSSNRPDERVVAQLEALEPWMLGAVWAVVALNLTLWFSPPLHALLPATLRSMVPNTVVGIALAAASLALSAERRTSRQLRTSRWFALAVLALGIGILAERAACGAWDLEGWFPMRLAGGRDLRAPAQTGLAFVLTGASLLLIREHKHWRSRLADVCAMWLIATVMVFGASYLYGAAELAGADIAARSSPQALFCFVGLAFLIAARRARSGSALAALVNVGIGSQIVRAVFPLVVLLPFAFFGVEAYLVRPQRWPIADVRALAAALESFLILCLTVWMGQRINRLERELRDLSLTDELTGVNNRRGFFLLAQQVARDAQRSGANLAVYFFDLDGLKRVNDTAGHEAGSQMIRDFAAILKENFRGNDVIGRVGGDEFAVIASGTHVRCADVLARLEQRVAQRNRAQPQAVSVEYSAGYAEGRADAAASLEALIARADAMMYQHKTAKQRGSAASTSGTK